MTLLKKPKKEEKEKQSRKIKRLNAMNKLRPNQSLSFFYVICQFKQMQISKEFVCFIDKYLNTRNKLYMKILKIIYALFRGGLVLAIGTFIGSTALLHFGISFLGWVICAVCIALGFQFGRKQYFLFLRNDFIFAHTTINAFNEIDVVDHKKKRSPSELAKAIENFIPYKALYIYSKQYQLNKQVKTSYNHSENILFFNFSDKEMIIVEQPHNIQYNQSFIKINFAKYIILKTKDTSVSKKFWIEHGKVWLEEQNSNPKEQPIVNYEGALFILLS